MISNCVFIFQCFKLNRQLISKTYFRRSLTIFVSNWAVRIKSLLSIHVLYNHALPSPTLIKKVCNNENRSNVVTYFIKKKEAMKFRSSRTLNFPAVVIRLPFLPNFQLYVPIRHFTIRSYLYKTSLNPF